MDCTLLALDASTSSTGTSVWVNGDYGFSDVIVSPKGIKGDEKLNIMILNIYQYIEDSTPDIVCTEMIVPTRNAMSTRMLQELTGAIRGYCLGHEIEYVSLRPTEWRKIVIDKVQQKPNGRKREDQKTWSLDVVNNKLGISTDSDDESDSILLGYSYINMFS